MACRLVSAAHAEQLVKQYPPVIYQQIKGVKDFLTPMFLDKLPTKEDGSLDTMRIDAALASLIEQPVLYYRVMEDDQYWYLLYMVYHPFDWSDAGWSFIRDIDSHRHDTECILFRIHKKTVETTVCTVFHNSLLFKRQPDRAVCIQQEGHGIRPFDISMLYGVNYMVYHQYELKDLASLDQVTLELMESEFKGATNMPGEQVDFILKLMTWTKRRDKAEAGQIINAPDEVFVVAERYNRIM